MSLKMRVLRHLKHFASTSSIHGLAYIVRPNGTKRSKIGWALVFIAAVLYASLELRKQVFCKFFEKVVKFSACIINPFFLVCIAWYTHPVKSVVVTIPLDDVTFPAVTICPYSSSPDRWGTALKIFDHMKIKCESKR